MQERFVGRVLRADIRLFVAASRLPEPDVPTFGTFVQAPIQQGRRQAIGLVYDIRLQDDPFLREIAAAMPVGDQGYEEVIRDQREARALPVEISIISVGYRTVSGYRYGLPPQPPMLVHDVHLCSAEEVFAFTEVPDFLRPLLESRDLPADELMARALIHAANLRPQAEQRAYLTRMGRYLARYLGHDPLRLEKILRQIGALLPSPSTEEVRR